MSKKAAASGGISIPVVFIAGGVIGYINMDQIESKADRAVAAVGVGAAASVLSGVGLAAGLIGGVGAGFVTRSVAIGAVAAVGGAIGGGIYGGVKGYDLSKEWLVAKLGKPAIVQSATPAVQQQQLPAVQEKVDYKKLNAPTQQP